MTNHKALFNKLDQQGFTLTEMLVTTLILVLASTLMATGIPVAIDTFHKTVDTANAQLAMSTTITVLKTEIGLATDVKLVSKDNKQYIYYYNENDGCWAYITNAQNENQTYHSPVKQLLKGLPTPSNPLETLQKDGVCTPLLSDASVDNNLSTVITNITQNDSTSINIGLNVTDKSNNLLASIGYDKNNPTASPADTLLTRFTET